MLNKPKKRTKIQIVRLLICVTLLSGCQQIQTVRHPIPVSLTPTVSQLSQKPPQHHLPKCDDLPKFKNRQKSMPCLPNTSKTHKRFFILEDWF